MIQHRPLLIALFSATVLVLSGCGGGGDSAQAPVAQTPAPAPSPSPTPAPAPTPSPSPSPSPAPAGPIYYFSDCQTGAISGCMQGNNSNAGTSASAPKRDLSGFDVNAAPAGTQLLFARGGVWTNFSLQITNPNVTVASPLVFDTYTPSWGSGSSPVPWLKGGNQSFMFLFGVFGDTILDGGYTVRNFKLDGQSVVGAWGVFVRNDIRGLLLENLEITAFEIGVHTQNTVTSVGNAMVLRNLNIHHNSEMGMLGDSVDLLIENSTFANNNFSGSGFNHGIYLGGHGRNAVIRNNSFVNNSVVNGVCTGGNFTVHGQWDGMLIENNLIQQDASDGGCYGFSINPGYNSAEYFRNVTLRGNRVINLGGCAFCMVSSPGVVIENNLVINTQATYQAAILVTGPGAGSGDDPDGASIIRNNTIYSSRGTSGSSGVALRAGSGANIQVVSNLVAYGTGSSYANCFEHSALSNFTAFNNNLCFNPGSNPSWSTTYATLTAAKAAGFDLAGISADPLFVAGPSNGWNEAIQAGSPARGAGHPTRSSATDRLGVTRTTPSIGARQ